MSQDRPEGLGEEEVRRIIREETMGRGQAPPQATPSADPTPVGLAGFALTTFLFSIINAGWLEQIGTFIPLALFYGGLVQLVSGMWAIRNNNMFQAVVLMSYGAFWAAFGFFFFFFADSLGVLADIGASVGWTLVGWTVFTLYVWVASIRVNRALFVMFTLFMLTLIFLDLGFLFAAPALVVVGGYVGILLALCAWYISAAGFLNYIFFGRTVLPQGLPFWESELQEDMRIRTQEMPQESPLKEDMRMTQEENKTRARRYFEEVFNQGNLAAIDELVDPEWVGHDPAMTEEPRGLEGARQRQFVELYRSAFPDLTYTIEHQVAEGDKVVTHWTARGTHQGRLMNVRPTGKQVTTKGVSIDRIEGGKLVETWDNYDASDILRQVGALPSPERTPEQPLPQEPSQAGTPAAPEGRASAEELAIKDYDSLTVTALAQRLGELSIEEIERLRDYEAKNKRRRSLMAHIERRIRAARRRE